MKVLSFYLPQFHRVKENDEWWGEGFTEWVSARNAKPLFEGHYQPHIPLEGEYNLLEKDTMKHQAELMHRYGIDGQCFYHYWFKDGRRILEKPAENLLIWTDIDMPFCFCWANETWARSWSKIKSANVWMDGNQESVNDNGVLLEQDYGTEADWINHFNYLLPFFKDKRYINVAGKPVFVIYRSFEIFCLEEMIDVFNKLAVENGLAGIYFICANASNSLPDNVDAALIHEPQDSIINLQKKMQNEVTVFDYKECWNKILCNNGHTIKTFFEGFVGYDDTPRRGLKGTVINGGTPKLFEEYMTKLMAKSHMLGNELVFVNAWNEWGEGMHLEPDVKSEYGYLEAIENAKKKYEGIDLDSIKEVDNARYENISRMKEKFESYLNKLDQWMSLREKGVNLSNIFVKKKIYRIAIYGYGIFARHLIEELKDTPIKIDAVIDKQKDKIQCDLPVLLPGDESEDIDAIIVTSFFYFHEIKKIYKEKNIKVLSIENIIGEAEYLK